MYELKYVYGFEPVATSSAIERGLSYHDKVEQVLSNSDHSFKKDGNLKTNAMAMAFCKYILPQLERRHVMSVEKWFEYQLASNNSVRGRYDAICSGGVVVEHKTVSGLIDGAYLQRLDMDEQIPTYLIGSNGNIVCYTICSTPTISQRKGESNDEFEKRCFDWFEGGNSRKITVLEIFRSNEQLQKFREEQDAIVDEMANCKNYYRNPSHCTKWGRMCEYAPICMECNPDREYIQFKRRESK